MTLPSGWNDFVLSGEYDKIKDIMTKDGWTFSKSIDRGVVVIEPKRLNNTQSESCVKHSSNY